MGGEGEPGLDGSEVTAKECEVFHTCCFFQSWSVPPSPSSNSVLENASQREWQPGSSREATRRWSSRQQLGRLTPFHQGHGLKIHPKLSHARKPICPENVFTSALCPEARWGRGAKRTFIAFGNVFWRKESHKQTEPGWRMTGWRWRGRRRRTGGQEEGRLLVDESEQ